MGWTLTAATATCGEEILRGPVASPSGTYAEGDRFDE